MSKEIYFHNTLVENPREVKGHGCLSISFENVGKDGIVFVDKAPILPSGYRSYTCTRQDGKINQTFLIDYSGETCDVIVTREFYLEDYNAIKDLDK